MARQFEVGCVTSRFVLWDWFGIGLEAVNVLLRRDLSFSCNQCD